MYADPRANPRAMARTPSLNNSREPVAAIRSRIQGMARRPTINMAATKATSFPVVIASVISKSLVDDASSCPPRTPLRAGISTSARTIAMSSTINQPTAICPFRVSTSRRSCNAVSRTTVLATESARPNTKPSPAVHPAAVASPIPSNVAMTICTNAPGMAIDFTESKSLKEK